MSTLTYAARDSRTMLRRNLRRMARYPSLTGFLIGMPITPNIIQTMKHTVNANVLTASTDQDWRPTMASGGWVCFLWIN